MRPRYFVTSTNKAKIRMHIFSWVFLFALALSTALQLWLARRHIRHIATHRNTVPAAFETVITLPAHQKAADYSIAKTRLGLVSALLDPIILLFLTFGGGLQALHAFWAQYIANPVWQGSALIVSLFALLAIVHLPFAWYRTFVIDARFGFNKMTPKLFVLDNLKQAALVLALGVPLLASVLWLMEGMGEFWWLYVWLVWSAFNLLVLAIFPTFIAPLFNKFTPLEDAELKARIERLLEKCGFRSQGLFVMDGSRRSSHGNAYFTGFGSSKRIVFFDTLLARLNGEEIEAVLAHELGHFKKRHVTKRILWMFAVSLAGLWLLGWLMQQPWFFSALGVSTSSTALALMLFMLVAPVFAFILQPLGSFYSRRHEFEADAFAASTVDPRLLIKALVKLYNDNAATLTPDPYHSAFYDSHPPAAIRIAKLQTAA